ncbi:MAG TPA: glycoside hydrolase family 2 TIM barrel-domain containing protein [Planctomycetota bacterium]|nr:glycoside hydrolase family 2 TIM barrel-domain containing protein [Planctomycetota bacterium]
MRLADFASTVCASLRGAPRRRVAVAALALAACGEQPAAAPTTAPAVVATPQAAAPAPAPPPVAPVSSTLPQAVAPWLPGEASETTHVDLAGDWDCWLDPGAAGLRDDWAADLSARRAPRSAPGTPFPLHVPGPIESTEGTLLYDGVFWLARDVELPAAAGGARVALTFGQVNDLCRAWWDGQPLGEHDGGYDAFAFELTPEQCAPGSHRLVLMVLDTGPLETFGRRLRTLPHSKEDWYDNFGGVLGPVALELRRGWVASALALRVDGGAGTAAVELALLPPRGTPPELDVPVTLRVAATTGGAADLGAWSGPVRVADGRATLSTTLALDEHAPRWSPESPALLELRVAVDGARVAALDFGLRHLELRDDGVFLDGRRRVLKGVLWQPHDTGTGGMTPPPAQLEAEAAAMKAAGFDLVRAHVRPAPPAFLDACDRLGLMVLEEPAIGWVDDDPALRPRLLREVDWMVRRDAHHASIVLWGVLNELSGRAFRYADELVARVGELDPTRPVLRDSGGFLGAQWLPPGATAEQPMTDAHLYPPWPLPPDRRDELATLGQGGPQPTFASEFGYGALLDAERAADGFRTRGLRSAEAGRFRSFDHAAQAAVESGDSWASLAPDGSWIGPAARAQADALVDMADALRSNPALDMLCVTQWEAVSAESSAGLRDPWGEERPSLAALRTALLPLRPIVLPERPSWPADSAVRARLVVVNDGEATVRARVQLAWGEPSAAAFATRDLGEQDLPPGVSSRDVELAPADLSHAGALAVSVTLYTVDGRGHESARALVTLVPPPALSPDVLAAVGPLPKPLVWAPPGETGACEELKRLGLLAGSPEEAPVALLPHPERLGADLSFDERMALWSGVLRGGVAIALLGDPGADDLGRLTGAARGVRTLFEMPRPVAITSAAGNFSGRFHVLREGGVARLLGRGDESLSPVAMVAAPLPEGAELRMITLGFLGNRIGSPWLVVPFGAGQIQDVGLPLLAPVRGETDPLREAWLVRLIDDALRAAVLEAPARRAAWTAQTGRPLPAPWSPLPPSQAEELRHGFALLDQLVALGDRATPYLAGDDAPALPASVQELLARRLDALTLLLLGDAPGARETLRAAMTPQWTEETRAFVAGEARVLRVLTDKAAQGPAAWDRAWDAVDAWSHALVAWFGGQHKEAFDWLGRAAEVEGLPPEESGG